MSTEKNGINSMYRRLPIAGWPGYEIDTNGVVYGRNGKPMTPDPKDNGYLRVQLISSGVRKRIVIHKLMLETFDRKREVNEVCRHLNGDKLDNRISNLCWGTPYENHLDSIAHGSSFGGGNGKRKLTKDQVDEIRDRKLGVCSLAKKFNVDQKTVRLCQAGRTYKNI
jgi:hypothetical protein